MNFRKLMSGISAMAVAIGSFAGLSITAEAAGTREIDFIGSSSAAETFDSYTNTNNRWTSSPSIAWSNPASGSTHFGIASFTYVAGPAVGESVTDTTNFSDYPTYVNGKALDFQGSVSTQTNYTVYTTYTLPEEASKGKLYFSSSFYGHFGDKLPNGFILSFKDSDGNTVANVRTSANANSAYIGFFSGTNSSSGMLDRTSSQIAFRNKPMTAFDLGFEFDIDNNTAKLSADYITSSGVRSTAVDSGTAQSVSIKDIKSIEFRFSTNTKNVAYGWAFDNMKLYQEVDEYSVTESSTASARVSVDKHNAIEGETVTASAVAQSGYGDPVTISVTGNTSGNTIPVNGSGEFTMPAEDVTVTATATASVIDSADAITVSYRTNVSDPRTEVATKTVDISAQDLHLGDMGTYYVGMGIVGKDGNLYQTAGDNFQRTTTLATGTTTVTESVTLYAKSGYYEFGEWDGNDPYAYPQNYSNGKVSASTGNPYVTVTKAGYYDMTLHVGQGGASRQTTVVKGDWVDASTNVIIPTFTTVNGGTYKNLSNLSLEANDKITVHGSASQAYIDFIVLRRVSRDVTIGATGNGTITSSTSMTRAGTKITLTATPDSGYAFTHIYYTPTGSSPVEVVPDNGVYSFTMPDADVTITATTGAAQQISSLTVNCVADVSGTPTTIMTETPSVTGVRTGEMYTYSPYAYVEYPADSGNYYIYDGVNSSNGSVPQISRRATSVNEVMTLSYTAAGDVVDYVEINAQTNTDSTHSNYAPAANANASHGMDGGYVYGESGVTHYCYHTFSVPEDGTYKITANTVGTYDGSNGGCTVVADIQYMNESLGMITSTGGALNKASAEIDLDAGEHTLYFVTLGNPSCKLDYFVVELVSTKANLFRLDKQCKNSSFTFGKVAEVSGQTVSFTPELDDGYGGLIVTMRNASTGQTRELKPNGSGVYGFNMPSANVMVRSFATYSIPVEVDYNVSKNYGYTTGDPTNGDGKWARGFTFTAFHGIYTITGVHAQIVGKTADTKGGNTNNSGDTASSASMSLQGDAIFGIMIWTDDSEKVDELKAFDPKDIVITVDIS